jgi:transposase
MYDFDKENDKEFLREAGKHLQGRVLELEKIVRQISLKNEKDEEVLLKLSEELKNLRERVFNSKQERNANKPRNKKRKKGKLPHNQPANQPLDELEVALEEKIIKYNVDDESKCPDCGSDQFYKMNNCSEESSEIEVVERQYIVKRHQRQKYSCKCCNKIITAKGGVKLTPGGEYSIQLATQIACDKYEDHLPLERQRKQMHRAGIATSVKTLYGLTEHLYNRLFPLNEMIRQDVLSEKWVHIDESPLNFFNPKKSKGYVWSISNPRGAYYQFEPTRSGKVAKEILQGYRTGNVITDGFSGYDFLHNSEDEKYKSINHAYCWAHVRRKFFEAMNHDDKAEEVVDLIDDLYEVEHMADDICNIRDLRHDNSKKIVKKIDSWIESMDGKFLESSSLGKAINYYLSRQEGLKLFLDNEFIPIDNNMAERRQRCPVMGRKNFLHFKSINGADVGSFFYSVIESCKSNGLDARSYINEMAHRSANEEELESPYTYATKLKDQILSRLAAELKEVSKQSDST